MDKVMKNMINLENEHKELFNETGDLLWILPESLKDLKDLPKDIMDKLIEFNNNKLQYQDYKNTKDFVENVIDEYLNAKGINDIFDKIKYNTYMNVLDKAKIGVDEPLKDTYEYFDFIYNTFDTAKFNYSTILKQNSLGNLANNLYDEDTIINMAYNFVKDYSPLSIYDDLDELVEYENIDDDPNFKLDLIEDLYLEDYEQKNIFVVDKHSISHYADKEIVIEKYTPKALTEYVYNVGIMEALHNIDLILIIELVDPKEISYELLDLDKESFEDALNMTGGLILNPIKNYDTSLYNQIIDKFDVEVESYNAILERI